MSRHLLLGAALLCAALAARPPAALGGAAGPDFEIARLLPADDPFAPLEQEVLAWKGDPADCVKGLKAKVAKEPSPEDSYRLMRAYYRWYVHLGLERRQLGDDARLAALNKRIAAMLDDWRLQAEPIAGKYRDVPQIVELQGDLAYYSPFWGTKTAAALHYRALCLGLKSQSVLRKLALDFKSMYYAYPNRKMSSPDRYLIREGATELTEEDRRIWKNMANYFDGLAEKPNVLAASNPPFFQAWENKEGRDPVSLPDVREGLRRLYEETVRLSAQVAGEQELIRKSEEQLAAGAATLKQQEEARRQGLAEAVAAANSLLEPPNPLEEIESVMGGLKRFRGDLEKSESIPNYRELRAKFPDSEEPEVLNLYFLLTMKRDFKDVLARADRLKSRNDDVRVLFLRYLCLRQTGGTAEAGKCIDRILELEPDNYRARHLKVDMELQKKAGTSEKAK